MQHVHAESIASKLADAESLLNQLNQSKDLEQRIKILDGMFEVHDFFKKFPLLFELISKLTLSDQVMIKSILAIKQGDALFAKLDAVEEPLLKLQQLVRQLHEIDSFYAPIGGIIGYHITFLRLILEKSTPHKDLNVSYLHPEGFNLEGEEHYVREAVKAGILALPYIAEIYPVGGAGDRLNLIDEISKIPLPASMLRFGGWTLLQGMVRDLHAKEYLYYQFTGERITIPVALMTSVEKDNDAYTRKILKENRWFGRPAESYFFFIQPLAPVISKEGNWSTTAPLHLNLKPGGHGVMWRLAIENGIFDEFRQRGCQKALIRQINNPVAGMDHALLAFTGIGYDKDKIFGFASCKRAIGTHEGVDVLIEKKKDERYTYCLTNIEYTDFVEKGIKDIPSPSDSRFSIYPSNTNILFADLDVIEKAVEKMPFPGLLINLKSVAPCYDRSGEHCNMEGGRLESTMQNIADSLTYESKEPLSKEKMKELPTYVTFNNRSKTISVTKAMYVEGKSIVGTPEGCLYDMTKNNYELLIQYCGMKLPPMESEDVFLEQGPACILWYHPALGPLYSIIRQKIRGGRMEKGSELQLEIAELELTNLELAGSLRIEANHLMGKKDPSGNIVYGEGVGRCVLNNVIIQNRGIDRTEPPVYWKNDYKRAEEVRIVLLGESEFVAESVLFKGAHDIQVPDGKRMIALQRGEEVEFRLEPIGQRTRCTYAFDKDSYIHVRYE